MRREEIAERLKNISGVEVMPAESPVKADGIFEDTENNRTVFSAVVANGTPCAFYIDGTGEDKRAIAKLLAELCPRLGRHSSASPMREFLEGFAPMPVREGKADYYVFAVYCKVRADSVREYLSAMSGQDDFTVDMSGGIIAFCKKIEGDDYQSAREFAEVLRENIAEEIEENIKVGVGGIAHGVSELPQYYAYARSALSNGAEFDPKSVVYSYKEYALIGMLSELPATTMERFLKTALDKNFREVLKDAELMAAADAFIKHSLNISEASRSMYVHRNTLIYRLDKIEKMTGLNIRNFNDAMSFRTAYLVSKLL